MYLLALRLPDLDRKIHLDSICPMVQQENTMEVSLEKISFIEECRGAVKY